MAYFLTLILAVMITWSTLTPVTPVPPGLTDETGAILVPGFYSIAHVVAFAALAVPLAWRYPHRWVVVAAVAAAFGGLTEILQSYVGRNMEFADFVADATGAFFGAWCASRIGRRWRVFRTRVRSKRASPGISD